MRTMLSVMMLSVAMVGCGGSEPPPPKPSPKPAPAPAAPAPAPAPAPAAAPADDGKNTDISKMDDKARHDFLMKLGEKVYTTGDGGLACTTCHQANGKGLPGAYPPLVGAKEWMGSCEKHAGIIIHGLNGEIEVDGKKYNGMMTPQGPMLNDLQIAAVATYERNSWGNDFGDCMPESSKKARTMDPPTAASK